MICQWGIKLSLARIGEGEVPWLSLLKDGILNLFGGRIRN